MADGKLNFRRAVRLCIWNMGLCPIYLILTGILIVVSDQKMYLAAGNIVPKENTIYTMLQILTVGLKWTYIVASVGLFIIALVRFLPVARVQIGRFIGGLFLALLPMCVPVYKNLPE